MGSATLRDQNAAPNKSDENFPVLILLFVVRQLTCGQIVPEVIYRQLDMLSRLFKVMQDNLVILVRPIALVCFTFHIVLFHVLQYALPCCTDAYIEPTTDKIIGPTCTRR